jgi:HK97 family phage portal protein
VSLFAGRRERRSDPPGAVIPPPTGSGQRRVSMRITPDVAMQHSAVAACVLKIGNLAALDVHAYRSRDGVPTQVPTDPPLLRVPSAVSLPIRWRRELLDSWLKRGTAFGFVTQSDQLGYPTTLELIDADYVMVRPRNGYRAVGGEWVWLVDGKEVTRWPDGPLWVAPGPYTRPGAPVGVSPIEMALGAIRLGLAAEDYGSSWFYEGGQPSGVLQSDQVIDAPTAETMKKRFTFSLQEGGVVALGSGLKYDRVQVAANESQFLETLDKNIATVARYFLVPPEEIGGSSGNSMTYSNVEARGLSLLVGTYGPWIAHLEATLNALTPRPQTIQVDVTGLLRLDAKTRTDLDVQDIRAGIRSREEIRLTRGLGPVAPDDHIVWPPFVAARLSEDVAGTPAANDISTEDTGAQDGSAQPA